ncbi:hypothetical protein, partial [Streptomyces scabiei]|uniref:hypothetical protein n=1 Tax=Streptomyces scabiei TaxID=1930 RepID=UPI0038F7A4EA
MSRTIVQQNAGGREAQAPQDTEAAAQGMMRMLTGFWASQCLHVAARVSVADALQAGPQSVTALAH